MVKIIKTAVLIVMLVLFVSLEVFPVQNIKHLTLDARGIEKFDVDCGAGFLKISGETNRDEIEVEAEIILDGMSKRKAEDFMRDRLRLSLEKRGDTAHLIADIDSKFSLFSWGSREINLTVRMPSKLAMQIEDGSGAIWIDNIHNHIEVDDGSGNMMIRKMTGNVRIDDGSGEIECVDIGGDVEIDDGSGEISLEMVGGLVDIEDGSGSIRVDEAFGDVTIQDGSGSIMVDRVQRDVIIQSAGSGGVEISRGEGRVIR